MRRASATVAALGMLATTTLLAPESAQAHDPPRGTGLWWLPSSAGAGGSDRLIVRTNRGLLLGDQNGHDSRFLCNEALGIASTEQAPLAIGGDGDNQVFAATFAGGLLAGNRDLCQWRAVAGPFAGNPAFDVTSGTPGALFLLAGQSDTAANFFVSRDLSLSWFALAQSAIPFTRIRVAPSDAQRIYRTGVGIDANAQLVHRLSVSTDGGDTTSESSITLAPNELQARLLDIDPTNPDRLFIRVEGSSSEIPERLVISTDGGHTFTTALSLLAFEGFALSPDGATVWAGGAEGLWRSNDRGAHFDRVSSAAVTKVGCLALHGAALYACAVAGHEFTVGISYDRGDSFRKLVDFSQVRDLLPCSSDAELASTCQDALAHWRADLGVAAAPDPASGTTNAGTAPRPVAGCGIAGALEIETSFASAVLGAALGLVLGYVRPRPNQVEIAQREAP